MCSIGRRRLEVNTALFVKDRTSGTVSRLFLGIPHDAFDSAFKREPGCYDPIFLRWMQASLAGRPRHIDRIGISYMYLGLWKPTKDGHEFHVGPHLMVVGPNSDEFQGFQS